MESSVPLNTVHVQSVVPTPMKENGTFRSVENRAFLQLKAEIETYRRTSGHYIVDLVSISFLRIAGVTQEELLDAVFEHWDDRPWPPKSVRPSNQSWDSDYQVDADEARRHAIKTLVGGADIGHTKEAMSQPVATQVWERFAAFFERTACRYYVGMGLGNREFTYLSGVAIVDHQHAGILWVVESD